jgi:4-oxalocrotonate tautomerase
MPYVNIKVTQEGGPNGTGPSDAEKAELIQGVTELLQRVLNKDPETTFVVIDEVPLVNWGAGGLQVQQFRAKKAAE